MHTPFRSFSITLISFLLSLFAAAQGVELRSGECYEIRCVEFLNGAVVPAKTDVLALTHSADTNAKNALWRITKLNSGYYSIQHAETGLYMTHDGKRTTTRRYMLLTEEMDGMASQWSIYPGASHIIITNVYSQYLLNVRRDSRIVGLYKNMTKSATGNERFVLYDKKGKQVSVIDNQPVVFKAPEPDPKSANLHNYYSTQTYQFNFTLDGKTPVFDARSKRYLLSLPEAQIGKKVELKLVCTTFPDAQLFVNGTAVKTNSRAAFGAVNGADTHRLAVVQNGDTIARANLQFTFLPIVEITAESFSKNHWGKGQMTVHDATLNADSSYTIQVRNRGEWTTRFEKRSMGIKLKSTDGKKIDRSILGLRTDNYWVLDAMTIDRARMRSRVAMDLWNDFSAAAHFGKKDKTAHHASRGRMVEVFLNGKYHGIYNLCERIDRKQLQLAKSKDGSIAGLLYKADQWSTATKWGGSKSWANALWNPNSKSEEWEGWQAKYPEPSAKKDAQWQPLLDAIRFVCTSSDSDFCADVARYFDLPSVRDYALFIELLFATDNSAKNVYWAAQNYAVNPQLTPIPWDLDGTFGRDWNGNSSGLEAHRDYRKYLIGEGHQSTLMERLYKLNPDDWNEQMAERYRQLRRTHFDPDRLAQRFDAYLQLLEQSGANVREEERWRNSQGGHLDIRKDVEQLKQWLTQRIAFLDLLYQQ